MHFLPSSSASFGTTISRHFSSLPNLPKLRKIPKNYRPLIILQAQQALTDYLHATRSLSYTYAEHISKNSLFSLSNIISKVKYSHANFSKDFTRFLRYHPVNEFEFFFESIGIPFSELGNFLPATKFFLSDNVSTLNVSCALSAFGFPWNKLGTLYKEETSIFVKDPDTLSDKLCDFVNYGFDSCSVVGICLAFPFVLTENDDFNTEVDTLFEILKKVFLDYNLRNCVEGNVDASYEFCRKVKVFINLGCEKNEVGELMGKSWNTFLDCSEEALVQKVEFFLRLNARKVDVGMLLLRCPEILHYDLESPVFSAVGFLKQLGLGDEELNAIVTDCPYVLGKNRLANLPHSMRALGLHEWFFAKIMNGSHGLLTNFDIGIPDKNIEKDYTNFLERIHTTKNHKHSMAKLNFLLGIGFGENPVTMKVFSGLHGTSSELQERFDFLLDVGIEFSKLCKMLRISPKVLNQCPGAIEEKLNFLFNEVGSSLQYLDVFPGYLRFNLEHRIKPRCRIHMWLRENGFHTKEYSLSSIVATSENNFIARLIGIHPTVLKQWLECFSSKNRYYSSQEA